MIELKNVTGYNGSYSYNDKTPRTSDNPGSEFGRLMGGSLNEEPESADIVENLSAGEHVETLTGNDLELVTYGPWGNMVKTERFAGMTINVVV